MSDAVPNNMPSSPSQAEVNTCCAAIEHDDDVTVMAYLDKYGTVGIDARNSTGWTPLICAALYKRKEVATLLLERGADLNWRDSTDRTALDWAEFTGNTEMAAFLLGKGADIHQADYHGKTILMRAAERGRGGLVALVLEKGADIYQKDNRGRSALDWAEMGHDAETIALIKQWPEVQKRRKEQQIQRAREERSMAARIVAEVHQKKLKQLNQSRSILRKKP